MKILSSRESNRFFKKAFFGLIITCFCLTFSELKAQYCPLYGDCSDWIESMVVSNLNYGGVKSQCQDSGGGSYFYKDTIFLNPTTPATCTIVVGFYLDTRVVAWFDSNKSGTYEPAERIEFATTAAAGTHYATIPVDPTATNINTRIRIVLYLAGDAVDPCTGGTLFQIYQAADFPVKVSTAAPPPPSGGPTYCAASGNCGATGQYPITNVSLIGDNGTSINNNSSCNGYGNFTNLKASVTAGSPYVVEVTAGINAFGVGGLFVDWNNNGTLDDPGESFTTGNAQPFTFTLTPPTNATSGLKRMRVRTTSLANTAAPCGAQVNGEVEDYTLFYNNPQAPLPPCSDAAKVFPKDQSINNCQKITFRWNRQTGVSGYKFSLYEGGTALKTELSLTDTFYVYPSPLTINAIHKWIAVPFNANGSAVGCDTIRFGVSPNLDPVANIVQALETFVCQNSVLQLDGNPSLGTTPYTHSWNGTKNTLLSDTAISNPNYNTSTTGNSTFYYTVRDNNGCKSKDSIYVWVNPEAVAGTASTSAVGGICSGQDTTISYSSGQGGANWETSNSATGPWTSATLVQENTTTYRTGTLNVTTYFRAIARVGSCSDTSNVLMIAVNPTPVKPIVNPTSASICEGQTASLTATNFTSGVTWNDAGSTQSSTLVVSTTGSYTATVTINGCSNFSDPVTVTVNPTPVKPTIQVIGNNPACDGETVELKSSSPTDNIWSNGETTQSIFITANGNFTVTVSNSFGCSTTSLTTSLQFDASATRPVITSSNSGTICQGQSVVLTSSNTGSNEWSTGETTDMITVATSGSYSVTVSVANGCPATSDAFQVVVNPLPTKPSISQTPAGPVCDGSTIELSSSTAQSYLWNTGSTLDKITVSMSGDYALTVTDANGCENTSSVFKVTFNPLPAKPTISANSILCSGRPAELTSSSIGDNLWSTGSLSQSISITSNGDYTVTYTDANGCSATSDAYSALFNSIPTAPSISQDADTLTSNGVGVRYQWYDVNGPIAGANTSRYEPTVSGEYFVTVISAEGCESDQSAGVWFSGTGIFNRPATPQLKIYPNPSNGQFEVVLPVMSIGEWTLFDLSGRVLGSKSFSSAKLTINEALSKGVYILQVKVGDTNFMQRIEVN